MLEIAGITGTAAGEGQATRAGPGCGDTGGGRRRRSSGFPPPLPPCQLGHIPKVGKVEARNNREAEAAGEFLQ